MHERRACRCVAACVLTTHYHLLLDVDAGSLSASVGLLNRRYASAYNQRYGRRGHAFSDRFLAVAVESDDQLLTTYRYIARNPVEARICASPSAWRWSSYATLTGDGDRFAFVDASLVVEACGGLASLRRFVESDA